VAGVDAAGDEVIARALGRGAGEEGRFDFVEAEGVEGAAHGERNLVAGAEVRLHARAAQVEKPVAEAGFLAGGDFVFDLEGRRARVVQDEDAEAMTSTSPVARFGLGFSRLATVPSTATTYSLRHSSARRGRRVLLFVADDLSEAVAVAQVEEDELAEVAAAVHPAHQQDGLARIGGASSPQVCVRAVFREVSVIMVETTEQIHDKNKTAAQGPALISETAILAKFRDSDRERWEAVACRAG
jgi:hypothetical protein